MPGHDIIVIGASAGGVEALKTLIHELPADIPAAIFIVLHLPAQGPSLMPKILNRVTSLSVMPAAHDAPIQHGTIYVAIPDHHLLIRKDRIQVMRGPRENRHRPAVDPLFRTAAYVYGARVIGVVLSGALDDGTAGLSAIKRRGGLALVQDPEEALYPSMPRSAIENVQVDAVLPLAGLAVRLDELARTPADVAAASPVTNEMMQEVEIMGLDPELLENPNKVGPPSEFSCPECGGVLHEINDENMIRFRCRVGHAFSPESMLAEQSEALEVALWTALNTLEESVSLSRRMARRSEQSGQTWLAQRFHDKAHEADQRAAVIRQVLLKDETPISEEPSPAEQDQPRSNPQRPSSQNGV